MSKPQTCQFVFMSASPIDLPKALSCIGACDLASFRDVCDDLATAPGKAAAINLALREMAVECVKASWVEGLAYLLAQFPPPAHPSAWLHRSAVHPLSTPLQTAVSLGLHEMVAMLTPHATDNNLLDVAQISTSNFLCCKLVFEAIKKIDRPLGYRQQELMDSFVFHTVIRSPEEEATRALSNLIEHLNPIPACSAWQKRVMSQGLPLRLLEHEVLAWDRVLACVTPDHVVGHEKAHRDLVKFFAQPSVLRMAPLAKARADHKKLTSELKNMGDLPPRKKAKF